MAYEIARRNEADYRWFRFEAPASLLESLDHSLKIADGVLRFRIFKVDPDSPVMVPPAVAAPVPGREGREGPRGARSRPAGRRRRRLRRRLGRIARVLRRFPVPGGEPRRSPS